MANNCEVLLLIALCIFVCTHLIFINLQSSGNVPASSLKSSKFFHTTSSTSTSPEEDLEILNITLHTLRNELMIIKSLSLRDQSHQAKTNTKVIEQSNSNLRHNEPKQSFAPSAKTVESTVADQVVNKKSAVIFTMDCMRSYEENSRGGGAAGELIIRHSLEVAFEHFHIPLRIIRSDEEFNTCEMSGHDIIILDTWTWAAKGWVPKRNLVGHESKLYILDFFGSSKLRGNSLHLDPKRILTAFGSPWNTFLGYFIPDERTHFAATTKQDQGVIWGKDAKYYEGKDEVLQHVADQIHLVSTAKNALVHHPNIAWLGPRSSDDWLTLLGNSKFLLGLEHPLLGPSAVDAVSLGCMFINPIYDKPILEAKYDSQHPYIAQVVPDYVCSYHLGNQDELTQCIQKAKAVSLPPMIPQAFQQNEYFSRFRNIFEL